MIEITRNAAGAKLSASVTQDQLSSAVADGLGIQQLPPGSRMVINRDGESYRVDFEVPPGTAGTIKLDDGTVLPVGPVAAAPAPAAV